MAYPASLYSDVKAPVSYKKPSFVCKSIMKARPVSYMKEKFLFKRGLIYHPWCISCDPQARNLKNKSKFLKGRDTS
jgi:hypothetical protein